MNAEFAKKYPGFVRRLTENWPDKVDQIVSVIDGTLDLDEFEPTRAWLAQCYNRPSKIELKMCAMDHIVEGHGCEAIFADCENWPDMEYVNMGDTYNTTIMFDHLRARWRVMCWGDWMEEAEAAGRTYA